MGDNPWGGYTLEWLTSSPPPEFNFEQLAADSRPASGVGAGIGMKTFVVLFGIAAAFGAAIAVAYWFIAHEEAAGTALLSVMTAALVFATGYAVVAERDARLAGDRARRIGARSRE